MATKSNNSYMDFYEVLPANETESAEVEDESNDAEAALEDSDESFEDFEDEDESNESEDSDDDSEDASDTDDESEEAEEDESDKDKPEDDATKEAQQSDEEKQKQHNREMAEKRIQEKQQRESAIQQRQQEYIAAGGDDPMAVAVRQLQVSEHNNRVEGNTNKLTNGYERAVKDFPILTDQSPEIQREVDAALAAFQAMYVTSDVYGNPFEVRGDLYAYLQAKADSITALTGKGARQQIQSKGKEKSKAMLTPVRAPKQPKSDPMEDGFDEEANRY